MDRLTDYQFQLPQDLIARYPTARREDSRMMVIRRDTGEISHANFRDFPALVPADDLLVLNNAKVIPARFYSDDQRVEFLLLEKREDACWVCMVKPGRRMRLGTRVTVDGAIGEVVEILPEGERVLRFTEEPDLDKIGILPLPPYMHREMEESDRERYQTTYAKVPGSVAAPTAGLHFTSEILERLPHTFVTLHVGAGTFRSVHTEQIEDHRMHSEAYEISEQTAECLGQYRSVFAIGTTSVRVLESCQRDDKCRVLPQKGRTSIFIHPPMQLRYVDRLLTNFHLPGSTLLMLVSAMAGRELTLEAYRKAVEARYRFFSYGDCMAIL